MINFDQKKYNLLFSLMNNFFNFKKNQDIIIEISNNNINYLKKHQDIFEKYKKDNNKGKYLINFYILTSHLYEEYIIMDNKNSGIFYTPFEIVKYMINNLGDKIIKEIDKIKILDPAVGTGLFVIGILDFLLEKNFNKKDIYNLLKDNLYIFDIDKNGLDLLEKFLKHFFKEIYNLDNFKIQHKYNKDLLEFDFNNKEKFDIIIGNPPYGLSSKKYKQGIIKELSKNNNYKKYNLKQKDLPNDIYGLFYIKSLLSLKNDGIIEFITPNSILNNKTFYGVRKLLLNDIEQIDIIDNTFKKKSIGVKAGIDIVIVKIKKEIKDNKNNNLIIRKIGLDYFQKNTLCNFLILQKNSIDKNRLKDIFLIPFSIDLDQKILNILHYTYKNKKYKLIKDYFDSAMGIKTSNNKKYVSNIKTDKYNVSFIKGTSKEKQKNKVKIFDYINFEQLKKDRPKNSNIPQEKFLNLNIYKLGFPEIGHKGMVRAFVYKDMLVSNSIWIYMSNEKYKDKLGKKELEKIAKIINSEIYEKISKVYSNGIRIEKHVIDNLPLLLNFKF